jgi:hypothetical protein
VQVRLARSDTGTGKSGSMVEERTRIWVSATRRLKLLVQGVLRTVFILLWVQGSSSADADTDADTDRVTTAQLMLRFSLSHDSTSYAGPVSPLLTLVVLPEAGFTCNHK